MESESARLPPTLQTALMAELDPDEPLRWCGRPDAGRVSRRLLSATIAFSLMLMLFGGMGISAAWSTRSELIEAEASDGVRPAGSSTWGSVWAMGILGGGMFAGGFLGGPLLMYFAHRAATRTVYALTDTRLFSVILNRRGFPRITSVEPGHPLSITRSEGSAGRGDIHLYPPMGQRGGTISFVGVEHAREVERLIRTTFDPAG